MKGMVEGPRGLARGGGAWPRPAAAAQGLPRRRRRPQASETLAPQPVVVLRVLAAALQVLGRQCRRGRGLPKGINVARRLDVLLGVLEDGGRCEMATTTEELRSCSDGDDLVATIIRPGPQERIAAGTDRNLDGAPRPHLLSLSPAPATTPSL